MSGEECSGIFFVGEARGTGQFDFVGKDEIAEAPLS